MHVMISRHEDCVTIRVKNTLYHEIDLSRSFFADSSIHTFLFRSLLLRSVSIL